MNIIFLVFRWCRPADAGLTHRLMSWQASGLLPSVGLLDFEEIVLGAMENIQVDKATDAGQAAAIRILPKIKGPHTVRMRIAKDVAGPNSGVEVSLQIDIREIGRCVKEGRLPVGLLDRILVGVQLGLESLRRGPRRTVAPKLEIDDRR